MPKTLHLTWIILSAIGPVALFVIALPAQGTQMASSQSTMIVNTLEDEDNSDGDCSLREAIHAANDNVPVDACPSGDGVGADTIAFAVSGTITLTEQLTITVGGPLAIIGGGAITLSGNDSVSVLTTYTGTETTLSSLTISNGYANRGGGIESFGALIIAESTFTGNDAYSMGGGIYNHKGKLIITASAFSNNNATGYYSRGGGIYNSDGGIVTILDSSLSGNSANQAGGIASYGVMTITNSTLSGNSANAVGGIYSDGSLTIAGSTLSGNNAYYDGGGIYSDGSLIITGSVLTDNSAGYSGGGLLGGGTLTIIASTLTGNSAGFGGGGIQNSGTLTITNSTLSDNSAELSGGGIYNGSWDKLNISNSTLSGNSSEYGGGIYNHGTLTLTSSTLSGNSADYGGGIYSLYESGRAVILSSTIIAYSPSGGNCAGGSFIDRNYNLEDTDTCWLNPAIESLPNTDPLLGPLQNNGGPTFTHALLEDSPAIDAGDPLNCPPTDQRGVARPLDGNGDGEPVCDIGSFEFVFQLVELFLPLIVR